MKTRVHLALIEQIRLDKIERVAKAIWDRWPHLTTGKPRRDWKDVGPNDREATWLPLAEAAITACEGDRENE